MKIYDALHGFIPLTDVEAILIDSLPFQRLRYIRQLGAAFFVYPGATHTRFEHSLGVMHLASQIYDHLAKEQGEYWRQVVRLGALTHDLGHLPFSHVAEKAILGPHGHEAWTLKVLESEMLAPVWERVKKEDVIKIAIGPRKLAEMDLPYRFTPWEEILSEIITGDFFGADRIDYLLRDATCSGVTHGLFDYLQLIETLRVVPSGEKFELGIEENGLESCEALLLARHFMHRRVYQHSAVKRYTFHLSRFMKKVYQPKELAEYVGYSDNEILSLLSRARESDPDAMAIFDKKKRFRAYPVTHEVETKIPKDKIFWEMRPQSSAKIRLSFPVFTTRGARVHASDLSDLAIPKDLGSWVFVAPEYEEELCHLL